jgi:hypothetical protein
MVERLSAEGAALGIARRIRMTALSRYIDHGKPILQLRFSMMGFIHIETAALPECH